MFQTAKTMIDDTDDNAEDKASTEYTALIERLNHEVRTPLNGLLGHAEILNSTALKKQQKQYLNTIIDTALALLKRFNHVLDTAGLASSEHGTIQHFNLQELVENSIQSAKLKAPKTNIHLAHNLDGLPNRLIGDAKKLSNTLSSLIGNALILTQIENITISAKQINTQKSEHLDVYFLIENIEENNECNNSSFNFSFVMTFEKSDQENTDSKNNESLLLFGKKIAFIGDSQAFEKNMAMQLSEWGAACRIIKPFKDGTDPIINSDLSRFDAIIIHQSTENQKWCNIFSYIASLNEAIPVILSSNTPLSSNKKIATVQLPNPISPSSLKRVLSRLINKEEENIYGKTIDNIHILAVDDNPTNLMVLEGYLDILKAHITCAEDGAQAVKQYKENPEKFDFIFMDCQMPILNGYEASKEIRLYETQQNLSTTPIIALTAYVESENIAKAIESGMDDYLSKPITLEKITHCIAGFGIDTKP